MILIMSNRALTRVCSAFSSSRRAWIHGHLFSPSGKYIIRGNRWRRRSGTDNQKQREAEEGEKTLCCLFSSLLRCLEDSLYRDAFGASKGNRRRQEGLFPA